MTSQRPLIIAHRGARMSAPENTLPAFQKAIEMGVDGVEFDTLLTKDKIAVISHSNDLHDLTPHQKLIHDMTYNQLKEIDVGSHFSTEFAGERIPTLSSVLELYANTDQLVNIEIKVQPRWHIGVEKIVADLIYFYGLENRAIVSSFSPIILWRMAQVAPHIKRAFLTEPHAFFFLRSWFFARMLRVSGLHPQLKATKPGIVHFARKVGWKIFLWTANTPDEMIRAIELGVDGIITDDPLKLKELIDGRYGIQLQREIR